MKWFIGIAFLLCTASFSYADDIYTIVVKKQEEKSKYRWTLTDWLDTREKLRLQDLWFALHYPSPYEFFLGGSYQFNQDASGAPFSVGEIYGGAFTRIFGLEAAYESGAETRWTGLFDLRIFGFHDQGTNITLQGGLRGRSGNGYSLRNPLAGVKLTLYFARGFGIEGLYRHFFDAPQGGVGQSSERYLAGVFLEFKFLRLYGDYFSETDLPGKSSGGIAGAKFYF